MEATRYSCPCCGSALRFGSASQMLDCPACGNSFPIESVEEAAKIHVEDTPDEEMRWREAANTGFDTEENQHLRAYRCQTCGAEILCDDTTAAAECVYCGNPTVMPGVLTGVYKPEGVIPFKTSKEEAMAALKRHCEGKKLLPKTFFDESRLEKITGVYIPFWLFGCDAEADMTYSATKLRSYRRGNYQITDTMHYLVRRGGHFTFNQVPMDGSAKIEDSLMESIEPFDNGQEQHFTVAYLAGFQAQRHDIDAEKCRPRVVERIRSSVRSRMNGTVKGYASAVPQKTQIGLQNAKVRQVLMPVWLLNTKWKDRTYTFAMNGQTGRFIGDLPTDPGRFVKWLLGLTVGIGGGACAVFYALMAAGVM